MNSHKELQSLVYGTDPARMYSMVEVAVVDANLTADSLNVHLVLHVPRITESNTWPLLEIHQVGVTLDGQCFNIKHSELAVMVDGNLKQLDREHCTILNNHLSTCMMEETSNLIPSCIHNLHNCTLEQIRCRPRTLYDAKGLMVAGAQVFTISKQHVITNRPVSQKPMFFSWKEYLRIQVDGITFESPTFAPERYEVEFTPRDGINFTEFDMSFDIEDRIKIQGPLPHYNKDSLKNLNIATFIISMLTVVVFVAVGAVYFRQGLINLFRNKTATRQPEITTEEADTEEPERGQTSQCQYR